MYDAWSLILLQTSTTDHIYANILVILYTVKMTKTQNNSVNINS